MGPESEISGSLKNLKPEKKKQASKQNLICLVCSYFIFSSYLYSNQWKSTRKENKHIIYKINHLEVSVSLSVYKKISIK